MFPVLSAGTPNAELAFASAITRAVSVARAPVAAPAIPAFVAENGSLRWPLRRVGPDDIGLRQFAHAQ